MRAYLDLLEDVITNGEGHADRTGVGTRSVFGRTFRHDMSEGFPILTTKKVAFRWVAEELFWFLSGSTNAKDLSTKGVSIWDEWQREDGDLGPVYGKQFRDFGGVDQLQVFLDQLMSNPQSRRHVMTLWNPVDLPQMALPPCHGISIQAKVHQDDSLSLMMTQRSADILLGVPYNITSYGLFLSLLGWVTGRKTRELIITFGDLHLYNNHVEQATTQLSRTPHALPKLAIKSSLPQGSPLERLLSVKYEHLNLRAYTHHPPIKADVAV